MEDPRLQEAVVDELERRQLFEDDMKQEGEIVDMEAKIEKEGLEDDCE